MSKKFLHAFLAITAAACLLTSCRSDLNLSEVDTSMEAHLKMALPVGTIKIGISDVMGLNLSDTSIHVTVETEDSVLTWSQMMKPSYKTFTAFELKDQIQSGSFTINLYDELKDAQISIPGTGIEIALMDSSFEIPFILIPDGYKLDDKWTTYRHTLELNLSGINQANTENRVDSALLNYAKFAVNLQKHNFEGLDESWIDTVLLTLDDHFDRRDGKLNTIQFYPRKGGVKFGQDIEEEIGKTILQLMTDPEGTPSKENVDRVIKAYVYVKYSVPTGKPIYINKESKIEGGFRVEENGLSAAYVWGWFKPHSDMSAEEVVDISSSLTDMPIFKDPNTVLPFSRPRIEAWVSTQVAGQIQINGEYLRSVDKNNHPHFSCFDSTKTGKDSASFVQVFPLDECVNPKTLETLDSTTHLHLYFDEKYGHIDNLFRGGIPDSLAYKFNFSFSPETWPQVRIPVGNLSVLLRSKVTMPMTFHDGFKLENTAELENIDISQFDIDSLLGKTIEMKDSSKLGILMKSESDIPLTIKISFRCYKEDGTTLVTDPADNKEPFKLFDTDTLLIDPSKPKYENWANLTRDELKLFKEIKHIRYTLVIDDKSFYSEHEKSEETMIMASQKIKLQIGLTADIQAAIQLNLNAQ